MGTAAAFPTGPVSDVAEAIARMRKLQDILAPGDGMAWFNRLYLRTTEAVAERMENSFFSDAAFMEALDVAFANLYFDALARWELDPAKAPRAWAAVFERRLAPGVARIQFALAGMNAHINRDLPVAMVDTCRLLGRKLGAAPLRRDYNAVNTVLGDIEHEVRHGFIDDPGTDSDGVLHNVEQVVANWSFDIARSTAWSNAEVLWSLRSLPGLSSGFLGGLDRLVGLAGRGILTALP